MKTQELRNEPYVELTEKQRNAPCNFIGNVCMTHARNKSICEKLLHPLRKGGERLERLACLAAAKGGGK